jgi:hypothetical protein
VPIVSMLSRIGAGSSGCDRVEPDVFDVEDDGGAAGDHPMELGSSRADAAGLWSGPDGFGRLRKGRVDTRGVWGPPGLIV